MIIPALAVFTRVDIDLFLQKPNEPLGQADVAGGNVVAVSMSVHDKDGLCAMLKSGDGEETHRRPGIIKPLTILKAND